MVFPFRSLFPNARDGDRTPDDGGGDGKGPSIEPLTELLHLLRASGACFDGDSTGFTMAREPLSVPLPEWWFEQQPVSPHGRPPMVSRPATAGEQPYRPAKRPPVPLVTILDDGTAMAGETVRIREPVCLIGRSEGTIRIPHDPSISARHAELVRDGTQQPYTWYLRDLGSRNGTFVCCKTAPLRPDRIIILGSKRFRLQLANAAVGSSGREHAPPSPHRAGESGWPMLVETTTTTNPLCIRLLGSRLSVGRPGFGNQIEIDDPCLANVHAVITQTEDGTWWIQATPSQNGVWIQVHSLELTDSCRFQCGEQRFLFLMP